VGVSAVLAVFGLAMRADLQLCRSPTQITYAFAGCFSMAGEDGLRKSPLDDYLESRLDDALVSYSARHSAFSSGKVTVVRLAIPSFMLSFISPSMLRRYLAGRATTDFVGVLYCLSDTNQGRPVCHVLTSDESISNDGGFPYGESRSERLFSHIAREPGISRDLASELVGAYFIGASGQSVHDLMVEARQFEAAERVVEDSNSVFSYVFTQARAGSSSPDLLLKIEAYWKASFERISAERFSQQGERLEATRHLLRAIDLSPYYPYEDEAGLADSWLRSCVRQYRTMKVEPTSVWFPLYRAALADYPEVNEPRAGDRRPLDSSPSTFTLLREVLSDSGYDKDVGAEIERFFDDFLQRRDEWLLWAHWGDITKFVPQGFARIDDVFVDRIPSARIAYERALRGNPGFPLILLKLGTLDIIEAQAIAPANTRQSEALVERGMGLIAQSRLVRDKQKAPNDTQLPGQ
jgi:hypothetical protein